MEEFTAVWEVLLPTRMAIAFIAHSPPVNYTSDWLQTSQLCLYRQKQLPKQGVEQSDEFVNFMGRLAHPTNYL